MSSRRSPDVGRWDKAKSAQPPDNLMKIERPIYFGYERRSGLWGTRYADPSLVHSLGKRTECECLPHIWSC